MFKELSEEVALEITNLDQERKLRRTDSAQANFEHAINFIISNAWKAYKIDNYEDCFINLRSGYYSQKKSATNGDGAKLTYRQVIAAFNGLINCGLIEVTMRGGYSRERMRGKSTRYKPTNKLLKNLKEISKILND